MFAFSLDSVLLPQFVSINKTCKNILDIGTGNAPIPLILTTRTKAHIIGVEIQKEVYDLAIKSVKINKKEDQIELINNDINKIYKDFPNNSFDIITCNPPYFKTNSSKPNENNYKNIARHETNLTIDDLCKISRRLLKNLGTLNIVHRPERMLDILNKLKQNNLEPKRIKFIYPSKEKDANIMLIEAKLNGKPGLKIEGPLISHNNDGSYTEEIKKYFRRIQWYKKAMMKNQNYI